MLSLMTINTYVPTSIPKVVPFEWDELLDWQLYIQYSTHVGETESRVVNLSQG